MNNYKSQGQTFEEALVNLSEDGIFVEDPFFKQYMENIRKPRELGLEFDMEKAKKVVEDAVSGIDYSDLPEAIRNRTLMLDMDQLLACRPDLHISGDDPAIEKVFEEVREIVRQHDIKVITSPTGRRIPAHLVMEWQMPGGKMRPIDKNTEFTLQLDGDFSKLEEMCSQDVPKPKHPLMFKITDLVEGPEEFKRLRKLLERADEVNKCMGARKKDIDLSQVAGVTVKKAREMLDKQRKIAIVGGTAIGASLAAALAGFREGQAAVIGNSFDTWDPNEFAAITKVEKPIRDWEHTKLRRGKGHNKFKRKGKK